MANYFFVFLKYNDSHLVIAKLFHAAGRDELFIRKVRLGRCFIPG